MKKSIYGVVIGTISAVVIIAIILVSLENKRNPNEIIQLTDEITQVKITGGTMEYHSTEYGTMFDVTLRKHGIILFGRELWQKGDEIVFRVSAKDSVQIKIGLLPSESMDEGFGYNDYGMLIGEDVSVDAHVQEITFIVPETGDYGIGVDHVTSEQDKVTLGNWIRNSVNLTIEINQEFKNPLLK